jgi:hypothetical protein
METQTQYGDVKTAVGSVFQSTSLREQRFSAKRANTGP